MSTSPVAIVTGAARGLGLAMVERLLAEGYRVMAADLSSAEGSWNYELGDINAMGAALEANGEDRLKTCPVDVTDADSCAACVDATLQHFGQINLLVNNAGVVDSGPIDTFSEAAWDRIFAVNTKGIFLMTQAAVQALEGQENASIVNTASIAGQKGRASYGRLLRIEVCSHRCHAIPRARTRATRDPSQCHLPWDCRHRHVA